MTLLCQETNFDSADHCTLSFPALRGGNVLVRNEKTRDINVIDPKKNEKRKRKKKISQCSCIENWEHKQNWHGLNIYIANVDEFFDQEMIFVFLNSSHIN